MIFWSDLYQRSQVVYRQMAEGHQQAIATMQKNNDLRQTAMVNTSVAEWFASPAVGVMRILLERDGGEKTTRATSLVAYQPGSHFESHQHPKGEELLVLAGTFSDENGDYPTGTYVRNPPGSSHQPFSRDGCLIWVKLQQFSSDDNEHVVCSIDNVIAQIDGDCWRKQVLFDRYEQVMIYHCDSATTLPIILMQQGVEILVLSGLLADDGQDFGQGYWLRFPPGSHKQLKATSNTQLLIKTWC